MILFDFFLSSEGKTLKDIFVSEGFGQLMADKEKSEQKKCFSLLLLHGLLENFELLREGKFTHGDGHSKLFDYSGSSKENIIELLLFIFLYLFLFETVAGKADEHKKSNSFIASYKEQN